MGYDTTAATTKQRSFIADLLANREHSFSDGYVATALRSKRMASALIGDLLRKPKRSAVAVSASLVNATTGKPLDPEMDRLVRLAQERTALLADSSKGFFALVGDDGRIEFFQIRKQYLRDTLEIVGLRGAPGGFSRYRIGVNRNDVIRRINADKFEAMVRFAEHYSVCGRCAAELTDEDSRERKFGPDCWGQMKRQGLV